MKFRNQKSNKFLPIKINKLKHNNQIKILMP